MSTLIIPCAGRSSRYPNLRPKWMLTHPDGELMLTKVINAMNLKDRDRTVITVVKEQCEKYEADLIIQQALGDDIELCVLDGYTSSQSETVSETIKKMDIQGPFIAKDSDARIEIRLEEFANFLVGTDLRNHSGMTNVPGKSFLILNDQNVIIDIIEKSVSSNIINLGVYGFRSAELFEQACNRLNTISLKDQKDEFWLSHIVSYLIREGEFFEYLETNDFEEWGTLDEWQNMRRKHKCYFVDIDGVVFKNKGQFGSVNWNTSDDPMADNIEVLKTISENGGQIIFCTARPENQRKKLERSLQDQGLRWHQIVMECLHSQRVLINDYAPSNPYPSSIAVSIQRDIDNLRSYVSGL